ncbi:ATP-binding protein [Nostoc sp.]|uniref:ATP-binding protein n=1 Tax=Nostoc sp. TaxID=1180 RepID=UPI002FF91F9F
MIEQRPFPLQLLEQSLSEKLAYFKNITVGHNNLQRVVNELRINILEPSDTSVFIIIGVTGVGKTTLRKRLEKILVDDLLEHLLSNPGQIAVASLEAIPPTNSKFDHADYYIKALEALNEVLIKYKVDYDIPNAKSQDSKSSDSSFSKNTSSLRRSMEKVFINRQLRAFMVDEAQHLFATAGGHQLLSQMNWIKSLANITKTVHILFGTYELLNCSTVSGQIGRRSEDIHISRYHKNCQEDVKEFNRIIRILEGHLPLLKKPQLEKHSEYLIDYSVGCVGSLKSWLVRALRNCIENNDMTLTSKHLKKTELSPSRRKQIREEAKAGEKRFAVLTKDDDISATDVQTQQTTQSNSRNQAVGQRNPMRDTVGNESV